MVDISRETWEINDIKITKDNDGILRLVKKHIKEDLDHRDLQEITTKHHSNHGKHRYELVNEPKINAIEFLWTKI